MPDIKGTLSRNQRIEIGALEPHPDIQRNFDKFNAERLVREFDVDALRALLVVPHPKRANHYWVFEGQHRLWALRKLYAPNWRVVCTIYENAPIEKLADIQLKITRGTKAWRSFDQFSLKLTMGQQGATDIKAVVEKHGLKLEEAKNKGSVCAVQALEAIHGRIGVDGLNRVLDLLVAAFGKDSDAYHANMLRGAGLFFGRFNGEVDDTALASKLKKNHDAAEIIGKARAYSKLTRVSAPAAVAQIFVQTYNVSRRPENRLPDFH